MKKIIVAIFILLVTTSCHAQNKETYIEVKGTTKIDKGEIESYQVEFVISPQGYSGSEGQQSLAAAEKTFFEKVKAAGFDKSKFKEDKLGYLALQYYREGNLYIFETRNQEELIKANTLANNGNGVISIVGVKSKYKPIKDSAKLLNAALLNAKETAGKVAASVNKKLGDVLSVSDYNDLETINEESYFYKPALSQPYVIVVKFAIQ